MGNSGTTNTYNRHILVVDDNRSIHQDFQKIFAQFSPQISEFSEFEAATAALFGEESTERQITYQLDFASQGQEGLEMVRAASARNQPYAMAFIDVQMPPGWDGIETMSRIWEIAPDLQVVICTAFSTYGLSDIIKKVGHPDRFIVLKKPFDTIEVLQAANVFSEKWELLRQVDERARRLEESESRYRFLTEATPNLLWTATPDGNVDYFNERWCDYTGMTVDQSKGTGWQSAIHSEDLPQALERWLEAARSGGNFEIEYRLKRGSDGAYRWHLGRAMPMRNQQGEIIQWVGMCTDIEDKKRAENALRQANESLEKRVAERTAEVVQSAEKLHLQTSALVAVANGIVITDPAGKILWVNPAFTELTGYAAEEVAGKTLSFLKSGVHGPEFYKHMWTTICAGKAWHGEIVNRRKDGATYHEEMTITPVLDERGTVKNFVAVKRDISRRKRDEEQLRRREEAFRALADNVPDAVARVDRNSRFAYGNRALCYDLRLEPADFLGKTGEELNLPSHDRWTKEIQQVFETGLARGFEFTVPGPEGICYRESRLVPERSSGGEVEFVLTLTRDVTKQKKAEVERQLMDLQLRQSQKLEAVGQLAAGIAHEINTPTQYVGDNTRFLKEAFENVTTAMRGYTELIAAAKQGSVAPELIQRAEETLSSSDLEYHCEQIPAAINETLEGIERISTIVRAMKEFSHPGGREKIAGDINKAIESTVTVTRNEWKYVADVALELDPELPLVPCFISEFNQAILNLVINASHAIGDVARARSGTKGKITIRTRRDGDFVEVRVSDTGTGIPEAYRQRIFEPFFTTKDVGKGTGQGLTVVYSSIVKKHEGTVTFETEIGKGTTFVIRLPLNSTATNPSSNGEEHRPEAHAQTPASA